MYIFVVCFGRYINQKRLRMTGQLVQRNDFSSDNSRTRVTSVNVDYERINEDPNELEQNDDSLEENLTRPLLDHGHHCETDDNEIVQFTIKSSIIEAILPIDLNEWKESNFFFRLMMIIKSPVNLILKLTIPLVDYEVRNHNWNKATMIINCLIAPLFMVFATKSLKFMFISFIFFHQIFTYLIIKL